MSRGEEQRGGQLSRKRWGGRGEQWVGCVLPHGSASSSSPRDPQRGPCTQLLLAAPAEWAGAGGSQKGPENWTALTGALASESTGGLVPTSKGSAWGLSPWTVGLCPALGGVLAQMLPPGQRPRPPLGGRDLPPEADGQQYLDPVHWVMNDGSLRFLQEKEAQRMERGR